MSTLISKEFKTLNRGLPGTAPDEVGSHRNVAPEMGVKELLRSMGAYFELDPKKVNFWIRQMELDKKI